MRVLFPTKHLRSLVFRRGRVAEFIHGVVHIVAPADPEHFTEIRQRRGGANQFPLSACVSFPGPGYPLAVMSRNPDSAMIAERFIPNDGAAETIPRGKADEAVGRAGGVPVP